jgi:hypothetical protein
VLHLTVTHEKGGRSQSAQIRPGWTVEPSMEELKHEFEQVVSNVRAKAAQVKGEQSGRVEQIATEVEEALKDGEKGKVASRLEQLKEQDDALSQQLPDPKDVAEFQEIEEMLLGIAWENPQMVPNLQTRAQAISGKANSALARGDRKAFEAALDELKALLDEVRMRMIREISPEQRFTLMLQSFEHEASEAQRLAKMLAERGRPQHHGQVQQLIGKGQGEIRNKNLQGLAFVGEELQGLNAQMAELLRKMGTITD